GGTRNEGVHRTSGQFLLFLDADDMLHPEAIEKMVDAWANFPNHVIYTDYHVIHRLDEKSRSELKQAGRLVYSTPEEGDIVRYQTYDYDCALAQRQPRDDGRGYYLWCNVTALVPKAWHEGIGGFDPSMEAWEDWDYWIRLARKGVCFYRVSKPLLTYRFDTGMRRRLANPNETGDNGRQQHEMLLSYMRSKYKEDAVGCRSCGGRKSSPQPYATQALPVRSMNQGAMANVKADDLVTVQLVDGNTAKHPISIRGTSYGYRRTGDKFKMLRAHAALDGRIMVLENETPVVQAAEPIVADAPKPMEPPAPRPAQEEPSLPIELPEVVKIWGINEERAEKLKEIGVDSIESFREADPEEIRELLGVTPLVLKRMVDSASKL
ncbi:MAG: glycosyltransferase, partial [Phycisphaerales bacterium JB038]